MSYEKPYVSTMEKMWVELGTGTVVAVMGEHDDYIGFNVPLDPLANGWMRAGYSEFDGRYHLEAADVRQLWKGLAILVDGYLSNPDGLSYEVHAGGKEGWESGIIDGEALDEFLRRKRIPASTVTFAKTF